MKRVCIESKSDHDHQRHQNGTLLRGISDVCLQDVLFGCLALDELGPLMLASHNTVLMIRRLAYHATNLHLREPAQSVNKPLCRNLLSIPTKLQSLCLKYSVEPLTPEEAAAAEAMLVKCILANRHTLRSIDCWASSPLRGISTCNSMVQMLFVTAAACPKLQRISTLNQRYYIPVPVIRNLVRLCPELEAISVQATDKLGQPTLDVLDVRTLLSTGKAVIIRLMYEYA